AMANHEGGCETEADVRIVNPGANLAMAKPSDNQLTSVVAIPHPISPEEPRMRIKHSVLIACTCLFLLPEQSFADPDRATVLIENQTGKRVIYQFKWGADAQWKDFDLQPAKTGHTGKYIIPKVFHLHT